MADGGTSYEVQDLKIDCGSANVSLKGEDKWTIRSPTTVGTDTLHILMVADGHGGAIKALARSGATADMKKRGIEHISYWQVDNPNIHVLDPAFIGLHATAKDSSGEMSGKMLPKAEPKEKVGVFCTSAQTGAGERRTMVVEYSDLPDDLAEATNDDGSLKFLSGSPAMHMLGVAFIEKVAGDPAFALPYHRAIKKVPHIDLESGDRVEPAEPNAVKLERFVFDAIPMAERSIILETDRVEEFAPVPEFAAAAAMGRPMSGAALTSSLSSGERSPRKSRSSFDDRSLRPQGEEARRGSSFADQAREESLSRLNRARSRQQSVKEAEGTDLI